MSPLLRTIRSIQWGFMYPNSLRYGRFSAPRGGVPSRHYCPYESPKGTNHPRFSSRPRKSKKNDHVHSRCHRQTSDSCLRARRILIVIPIVHFIFWFHRSIYKDGKRSQCFFASLTLLLILIKDKTMSQSEISLNILIFHGESTDDVEDRHIALHFEFENQEADNVMIHVVGWTGAYSVQLWENYDPMMSTRLVGAPIRAGVLNEPMTRTELISFVRQTEPDNVSDDYNCQSWVKEVLWRFQRVGYLSTVVFRAAWEETLERTSQADGE